jgi:transposase-like protein
MERERLEALVESGATLSAMAAAFDVHPATVRRWLRREGLATRRMRSTAENAAARARGTREVVRECTVHGRTRFIADLGGSFRCLRCRSAAVSGRRRRIKEQLVREAGGACEACGYDRCLRALSFHHVDPATKSFGVAYRGATRSIGRARAEVAKCVLLCANCHMEVEAGLRRVAYTARAVATADSGGEVVPG